MKLLAIETSTETMSLAVQFGARLYTHEGAGGAQSSGQIIGAVQDLMYEAGLVFADLDAIVWGCGPGSFSGVRTACAVAQGLGFAHGTTLLGVNTLAACAQMAALENPDHNGTIVAALDARMDEIYVAEFVSKSLLHQEAEMFRVIKPTELAMTKDVLLCGNASERYPELTRSVSMPPVVCLPSATLLLAMAPALLMLGHGVDAAQAAPLYVRDKVAQTTAERDHTKARQS